LNILERIGYTTCAEDCDERGEESKEIVLVRLGEESKRSKERCLKRAARREKKSPGCTE